MTQEILPPQEMQTSHPWRQMEGESTAAFRIFLVFRSLPFHSRSLKRMTGLVFGGSRVTPPPVWGKWRSEFAWVERAGAWDEYLFRLASFENYGRALSLHESNFERADTLLSKVDEWLRQETKAGNTEKKFKKMPLAQQVGLVERLQKVLIHSSDEMARVAATVRDMRQDNELQSALTPEEQAILNESRATVLDSVKTDFNVAFSVMQSLSQRAEYDEEGLAEIRENIEGQMKALEEAELPPTPAVNQFELFSGGDE